MTVKKWWPLLVAVASILAVIGFGIFRKEILSAMPGSPWNELRDFQWESIVAGALGLMGGIFVITSSRAQIRAMEISTDKTINLAKNHHADELNAPLQLAYDIVDDLCNWSNNTLDHLEGIQEQVAAGTCNIKKLNSAIDRTYNQFNDRIEHIGDIRR